MNDGAFAVLASVVAILDRLAIPYVVGGSIASSLVGEPRATVDVDIAVSLGPGDVDALVGALLPDHYVSGEAAADAVRRRSSFNAIHLPTMQKVDLFVLGDGPLDRGQLARRQQVEPVPGLAVWVGSPEDQVLRKLWWYRLGAEVSERQWRDVLAILRVQAGRLDDAYLDRTASLAGLADLLDRARADARAW